MQKVGGAGGVKDVNKKIFLCSVFGIYCAALLYIWLFNGRYRLYDMPLSEYIQRSVNLIPFLTVTNYIKSIGTGTINLKTVFINLAGNIFLFTPLGFLLPAVFRTLRKFWKSMLTVFFIVLAVEALQLLLQIGVFDIDDFILNLLGAALGYGIWKWKPIQKFINV